MTKIARDNQLSISADAILDKFEELLLDSAINEISPKLVVQELGCSPRLLFRHFRTKLEVADALAARRLKVLALTLQERCSNGNAVQQLELLLRVLAFWWIDATKNCPGIASVMVLAAERNRRPVMSFKLFVRKQMMEIIEGGVRREEFPKSALQDLPQLALDIITVVADPRIVGLFSHSEIVARGERLIGFILAHAQNISAVHQARKGITDL